MQSASRRVDNSDYFLRVVSVACFVNDRRQHSLCSTSMKLNFLSVKLIGVEKDILTRIFHSLLDEFDADHFFGVGA